VNMPDFVEARWFVCHTKPRCEKKLSSLLLAENVEHYLPLIESVRRYGPRTRHFSKPLFPGYVFAKIGPAQKARIYQQDLLVRAIPVVNETVFLHQIADIRLLIASGVELTLRPPIKKGSRVRVISGPLWGLEGVVDDPDNPKGIIVAVDVLQQGLHVPLPPENIEVLP
jgi:transcriptional antiterminator RfaH